MRVLLCCRCEKRVQVDGHDHYLLTLRSSMVTEEFDLCVSCRKELGDWMKGKS